MIHNTHPQLKRFSEYHFSKVLKQYLTMCFTDFLTFEDNPWHCRTLSCEPCGSWFLCRISPASYDRNCSYIFLYMGDTANSGKMKIKLKGCSFIFLKQPCLIHSIKKQKAQGPLGSPEYQRFYTDSTLLYTWFFWSMLGSREDYFERN